MCNPAIIMGGIAATQTVVSAIGENSVQKEYAKASMAQTRANMQDFTTQVNQQNTQYSQEIEAANQEAQSIYLQNLEAKATAEASAAGSGITGISIDNLFRGYDKASNLSEYISEKNIRNQGLQYNEQYNALRLRARNSIKAQGSYQGAGVPFTLLGGILSTGGAAMSGYAQWKGHK